MCRRFRADPKAPVHREAKQTRCAEEKTARVTAHPGATTCSLSHRCSLQCAGKWEHHVPAPKQVSLQGKWGADRSNKQVKDNDHAGTRGLEADGDFEFAGHWHQHGAQVVFRATKAPPGVWPREFAVMERVSKVVGQADVHFSFWCPQQLQCHHLDSSHASRQGNFLDFGIGTQGVAQIHRRGQTTSWRAFERLMHDPRINVHLIAMPKVTAQQPPKRPLEPEPNQPSPVPKKPFKRPRPADKPAPQLPDELTGLARKTDCMKCLKPGMEQRNAEPVDRKGFKWGVQPSRSCSRPRSLLTWDRGKCMYIFLQWTECQCMWFLLQFNSFRSRSFSRILWYRRRALQGSSLIFEILPGLVDSVKSAKTWLQSVSSGQKPEEPRISSCIVWFDQTARFQYSLQVRRSGAWRPFARAFCAELWYGLKSQRTQGPRHS